MKVTSDLPQISYNYACKIIVIPKQIPTQNCFYLVIHFLSSTTNVILHPLNTHFSRLIPRPVYTLFSQQWTHLRSYLNNSSSCPTRISKHSKTINKNTGSSTSCFHTLFSRVCISRWNTRSRCSNITSRHTDTSRPPRNCSHSKNSHQDGFAVESKLLALERVEKRIDARI